MITYAFILLLYGILLVIVGLLLNVADVSTTSSIATAVQHASGYLSSYRFRFSCSLCSPHSPSSYI